MTVRAQVLEYVKGRLSTILRTIHLSDMDAPLDQVECPVIVLVDRGDTAIETLTVHYPRLEQRTGDLEIAVLVRDLVSIKGQLADYEGRIEFALAETAEINSADGLTEGLYKTGSSPSLSTDADQFAGRLSLFYQYQYQVYANAPTVAL